MSNAEEDIDIFAEETEEEKELNKNYVVVCKSLSKL
jgi:hypothetical protein